jgi:hypothetical protein
MPDKDKKNKNAVTDDASNEVSYDHLKCTFYYIVKYLNIRLIYSYKYLTNPNVVTNTGIDATHEAIGK